MGIVFFCQSCGARFEVDPRMAGKKGRCKTCGQHMAIPRAEEIASMAAMPALAAAAVGGGVVADAAAGAGGASIGSRLQQGVSKIALAPITLDRVPIGRRRPTQPSPLDDAADSKPYALAQPVRPKRGRVRVQDNVIARVWRRQLGGIQKLFRKLNQAAYLVSVPFLMILILGAVVGSRPLALFGATVVVLLNIGRLAAGVANLAVVPFRDGINFHKMKKPAWRVAEPALTIGLVVLAFTFIPWLSRGQAANRTIPERIRSGAQDLQKDMKGEVDQYVDVNKLGAQAQEKFKELGVKAKEQLGGSQSAPRNEPRPSAERRTGPVRSAIEALEKRTQEEVEKAKALDESQKRP